MELLEHIYRNIHQNPSMVFYSVLYLFYAACAYFDTEPRVQEWR